MARDGFCTDCGSTCVSCPVNQRAFPVVSLCELGCLFPVCMKMKPVQSRTELVSRERFRKKLDKSTRSRRFVNRIHFTSKKIKCIQSSCFEPIIYVYNYILFTNTTCIITICFEILVGLGCTGRLRARASAAPWKSAKGSVGLSRLSAEKFTESLICWIHPTTTYGW